MYESPISIMRSTVEMQLEGEVMKAVQKVGISVDREELIRALQYDRGQYEKGYADAKAGAYTAHEVAVILAELTGDTCACNFNGIDEWLPFVCELQDACPNTIGVACWEQYLKWKGMGLKGGDSDV